MKQIVTKLNIFILIFIWHNIHTTKRLLASLSSFHCVVVAAVVDGRRRCFRRITSHKIIFHFYRLACFFIF